MKTVIAIDGSLTVLSATQVLMFLMHLLNRAFFSVGYVLILLSNQSCKDLGSLSIQPDFSVAKRQMSVCLTK